MRMESTQTVEKGFTP